MSVVIHLVLGNVYQFFNGLVLGPERLLDACLTVGVCPAGAARAQSFSKVVNVVEVVSLYVA